MLAKTNEFGGIMHSLTFFEIKLLCLKFFGSTTSEFILVKTLNSFDRGWQGVLQRAGYYG